VTSNPVFIATTFYSALEAEKLPHPGVHITRSGQAENTFSIITTCGDHNDVMQYAGVFTFADAGQVTSSAAETAAYLKSFTNTKH